MKITVIPGVPKQACVTCGARARPGEMVNGRCWKCGAEVT